MLNLACRNTAKLIREQSKTENVRLGRLFTKKDTARRMAEMFDLDPDRRSYTVLDPGAGTGILSAALVEEICKKVPACRQIFLTCFETDPLFLPMLRDNLERIRKKCRHDYDVKLFSTVYAENYIVDSKHHYTVTFFDAEPDTYDLIICNPPADLVGKASEEASSAGGVTQVKINQAFLFAKMASRQLEEDGQLVIVLPTTVASAASLSAYRMDMAKTLSVRKIHLFIGVQKNRNRAIPLKKSIILGYGKCGHPQTVDVTVSTDAGKPENTETLPPLDYDFVVDPADGSLTLPKSIEETKIVRYISDFPETLTSLGLRMSTGRVIDSRCRDLLFTDRIKGTVPLIRPAAIRDGGISFPLPIPKQYLAPMNTGLLQKNKNMVIIKRIPAKSDERFVNAAIYLAAQLPEYRYISTHNKINFIDTKDPNGEICARLAFGIFALLNSTLYDRYLSIVSKSKQINSKEMRSLPLPPRNIIENIGLRLMAERQTTVKACDAIVNPTLHVIVR